MGLSKVQSQNISQHGDAVEGLETHLIDIVLNNSSPDHGSGTGKEPRSDPLDRGEVYAYPAEARVEEEVEDRYENNQRKRVKIVDDIVGNAIGHHSGGL
jgi:hypothetical protein